MSSKESPFACPSRRSFLRAAAVLGSATAIRVVSEPLLARAESKSFPPNAVVIDANENPLGPSAAAREAAAAAAAQGGRYSPWLSEELTDTLAAMEGVKREYIRVFPGSSEPLHYSVLTFTSPEKSYVTADPGYEAGMHAAKISLAPVVKTPLAKSYAHDVKRMLEMAPGAGLFYICSPNNPTGTLTPHSDIEFLLDHKPKGSVVVVDEAYIHFSDALSAVDFVKADRDIIVLRTFSKIYGMAGLRCGLAMGRPDLLERIAAFNGWNAMPITAVAAATASLKDTGLVAERKKLNRAVRSDTFRWLEQSGYAVVPSESNCFMVDSRRPAKEMIDLMAAQNVFIGRVWPAWPTHLRITVGTPAEMERFQAAFLRVIKVTGYDAKPTRPEYARRFADGMRLPDTGLLDS